MKLAALAVLVAVTLPAAGPPQLSPQELVPFLKVITASVGAPGRVACRDIDLAMQFKKAGLSPDAKSPVAFAASSAQIAGFLSEGKLVVSGEEPGLAEGAGIVVFREQGKPVLVVSIRNAAAGGFVLSDTLLKIARSR